MQQLGSAYSPTTDHSSFRFVSYVSRAFVLQDPLAHGQIQRARHIPPRLCRGHDVTARPAPHLSVFRIVARSHARAACPITTQEGHLFSSLLFRSPSGGSRKCAHAPWPLYSTFSFCVVKKRGLLLSEPHLSRRAEAGASGRAPGERQPVAKG